MLVACLFLSSVVSAQDYIGRLNQLQAVVNRALPVFDNTSQAYLNSDLAKTDMSESYPLIHEDLLPVMQEFLQSKQVEGSAVEKKLYAGMDLVTFVDRLFTKRPLAFLGSSDTHLLRNASKQQSDHAFDRVGTDQEAAPYVLADYMSYDEMMFAAMCGVSSPTTFRNAGGRMNQGAVTADGTFQERGVYVGLVGARFERFGLMESVFMEVNHQINNSQANHPAWKALAQFYNFTDGVVDWNTSLINGTLDTERYKKRIKLSYELFFLDAENRGRAAGNKTYCHLVGLGTGVWAKNQIVQERVIWDVVHDILNENNFQHIGTVDFSWFDTLKNSGMPTNNTLSNGIQVLLSRRDPAAPLTGEYADQLLVAMYAWDGNAFIGNEYWQGSLTASGDPAAVACSNIGLTQNPLINTEYINGSNARVLFRDGTSIKLADKYGSKRGGLSTIVMLLIALGGVVLIGTVIVAFFMCRAPKTEPSQASAKEIEV